MILDNWEGAYTSSDSPTVSGAFHRVVSLRANIVYRIYGHVWTSKSIGIYTAGSASPNHRANGTYTIRNATILGRGPIAFEIIGSR